MNLNFLKRIFKNRNNQDNSDDPTLVAKAKVETSTSKNTNTNSFPNYNKYETPTYDSIRSNIIIQQSTLLLNFHDMAYVASSAKDALVVSTPVKQSISGKSSQEYNRVFKENFEFAQNNFKKNIKASKKIGNHCATRTQLFDSIKSIYPNFAQNMKKKVSEADYELYLTTMKAFKKSLSLEITCGPLELLSDSLAEAQRKISEVLSSSSFPKACEIEDRFIISEIDTFFSELAKADPSIQKLAKRATISLEPGAKISTVDFASRIREERLSRLKKYSEMSSIFEKLPQSQEKTSKSDTLDEHSEH